MAKGKKTTASNSKQPIRSTVKKTGPIKKQVPSSASKIKGLQLAKRRARHYQPEIVTLIDHSLKAIKPVLDEAGKTLSSTDDTINTISDVKRALAQLADTLTDILTDDPNKLDKQYHHDLLAHLFDMPGTDHNGIHLVALSNLEVLSEDLQLDKNSREYHWLMNTGMEVLERNILLRINDEMKALETDTPGALIFQNERAIELESIKYKNNKAL
ncbi:MAG: hypothetical protein PUP46_00275 [Endozoicomonas sp. (ex Botrylloides leachii)]|nr:hypothetical protein [Endozoicomonas sp. (ex Botrylloides leachii)]